MSSAFLTGLDIGTSSIKAVVVENKKNKPVLRAAFKSPSAGLKKGAVADLADATQAISRALSEVKQVSRSAARNVYVNIGTHQTKTHQSRGRITISRSDTEIYKDDVERALKDSQVVSLPPNREIVHTIIREYVIDDVGDIPDPLGLSGSRLEVLTLVIEAFSPHIKNLTRVVELGGGTIGGLAFSPLAASRAALSKAQKDLGVVVLDIGAGTTGMSVYEENKLAAAANFPVGSSHVSSDLAVGLKIPVSAAEEIKLQHGHAYSKDVPRREAVEISEFHPPAKEESSPKKYIAEIIEARFAEIFELISNELKVLGKNGKLPGGVVLVGGGAKIPGLVDLAKDELKLSSQIGTARGEGWGDEGGEMEKFLSDPEFTAAFGLAAWGANEEGWTGKRPLAQFGLKDLLKYFQP